MTKRIVQINGITIAIISSDDVIISDAQSALDLISTIRYYDKCGRIVLNKQAFAEDFFKLSTGLAGEVLQKFTNYYVKLAIAGDFSAYTSKPLKDFIYECNRGRTIFFAEDEQTAISRLAEA